MASTTPVQPSFFFLEWTGDNLDEWQELTGAWVDEQGLWFGPSIGPLSVGSGAIFQEGAGVQTWGGTPTALPAGWRTA